jgi:hypothetical protein
MEGTILPDEVRDALRQIVVDYGIGILQNHQKVRALLADFCVNQRAQRYVIVTALEHGIPGGLETGQPISAHAIDRLSALLRAETGIGETECQWAVETIALASGTMNAADVQHHHFDTADAKSSDSKNIPPSAVVPHRLPQVASPPPPPKKAIVPVAPAPSPVLHTFTRKKSIGELIGSAIRILFGSLFVWWLGDIPIYLVLEIIGKVTHIDDHAEVMNSLYVVAYGLWMIVIVRYQVKHRGP